MLAAPPTRTSWRRSSGRTRRVAARKHSRSAPRIGSEMARRLGMVIAGPGFGRPAETGSPQVLAATYVISSLVLVS